MTIMQSRFVRRGVLVADLLRSHNLVTVVQNRRRMREGAPRVMLRRPMPKPPSSDWSQRRINILVDGLGASRYLEIGIYDGWTAENIHIRDRVGVDPVPMFNVAKLPTGFSFFAVESDTYFASLAPEVTFDLAFLDGLHTFEQTKSDLCNALRHVPSGVILIDDTVPIDEIASLPDPKESLARRRAAGSDKAPWMGDVWKLVVYIERYLPQLDFRTIVGSGNVQTLVWRRQPGEVIFEPSGDELATIAGLNYREFFSGGVPVQFKPCSESEALRACLSAVTRHRTQ
jgi:hypothetical protein